MQDTQIPSQSVVNNLCCPISLEPFKQAQMVNCDAHHSFSLASVEELFGKIIQNGHCEKEGLCPICRGRVTTYHNNLALQSLVDAILGIEKGQHHLETVYALVRQQKMAFDSGEIYPIAKSHFFVRTASFQEKFIELILDKKNRRTHIDSDIEVLAASVEIFDSHTRYRVYLSFDHSQEIAKRKLLGYLRKYDLTEFEEVRVYQGVEANLVPQKFLVALRLLMNSNEFDEQAKSHLERLLLKCETLMIS